MKPPFQAVLSGRPSAAPWAGPDDPQPGPHRAPPPAPAPATMAPASRGGQPPPVAGVPRPPCQRVPAPREPSCQGHPWLSHCRHRYHEQPTGGCQ